MSFNQKLLKKLFLDILMYPESEGCYKSVAVSASVHIYNATGQVCTT